MLTENITSKAIPGWYPFDQLLSRAEQSLRQRAARRPQPWAHHEPFSDDDAYRALDTAERLLRRSAHPMRPTRSDGPARPAPGLRRQEDDEWSRPPGPPRRLGGLLPWREVLRPHDDVATGNFQAAEFAADLYKVARGEGDRGVRRPRRVLPPHLPHRGSAAT